MHYCLPTLLLGGPLHIWKLLTGKYRKHEIHPPQAILVIRPDNIGDVVLSSSMLRELRHLYPNAHIALVVSSTTRALVDHCPYVDEVLDIRTQGYPLTSLLTQVRILLAFCQNELRRRRWDLALIPRWDADCYFATLMCQFSGAVRSVAFSEKTSPKKRRVNWGFDALVTDVLQPGPLRHEAERNLDIVRQLGGDIGETRTEVWLTPEDEADAVMCRDDFGLTSSSSVIAFGVGSSQGKTRWSAVRFAELIDHLRSSFEFAPAIVCGPDEAYLAREVQKHTDAKVLMLCRPSINQAAAFISHCNLFIGNDSGPLHIASAVGLPVVEISCHPVDGDPEDANSPDRFGPLTSRSTVVRPRHSKPPCIRNCTFHEAHCIAEVTAAQVADAARQLLATDRCVSRLARA
jgi:heptosyltransferase-2